MVPISTNVQAPADDSHRIRLLQGFADAVSEHGYAAVTLADIVRCARMSKRTFYEHFADKESCFLATYVAATTLVLANAAAAFEVYKNEPWEKQLEASIDAYVSALESNPALTRACLVEIHAAGPRAIERRREVHAAFAKMLRSFARRTQRKHPEVHVISEEMATAVVGGINELLVAQVERGPQNRLPTLRGTAFALMKAVLTPRERR
jgi:AcrR family transcriptional regulator